MKRAIGIILVCIAVVLLVYVIGLFSMFLGMFSSGGVERTVRREIYQIASGVCDYMNYYGDAEIVPDMPTTASEWYDVLSGSKNQRRIVFLSSRSSVFGISNYFAKKCSEKRKKRRNCHKGNNNREYIGLNYHT